MADLAARLDGTRVVFGPRLVEGEYKLLSLEGELLKHVTEGKPLFVKAASGADAVVCTASSTFELQTVETSNTLLLVRPSDASGPLSTPTEGAGADPDSEVVGLAGSAFEAKLTPPRIALMHTLLQRSMLTIEDAKAEAMEEEPAEAAATPSPGGRKRPRAGADAAPVTPAGKTSSAPAEDTPAGKLAAAEARRVGSAMHFTRRDLEACVQASSAEIGAELEAMGTVERNGFVRMLSPELRHALHAAVLDAVADNSMPLLAVRPGSIAAFVGDSFPESLVRHALVELGRPHPAEAGKWCISIRRAARALGRQLLGLIRERSSGSSTGLVSEAEFFPAWRAAVGKLVDMGGPKTLAEASGAEAEAAEGEAEFSMDGFEASADELAGLFLRVDKAGEPMLEPFAAEDLDLDPAGRFRQLFAKQTEWTAAELEPFVGRLVGPGRSMADLLLRFTRVVNKSDGRVVHTKR